MQPGNDSLEQEYSGSPYDSSLESPSSAPKETVLVRRPSLFRANKAAVLATVGALLFILVVGVVSVVIGNSKKPDEKANSFAVTKVSTNGLKPNREINVSKANNLSVNGQLKVSNSLILAPSSAPASPQAGQIYYDKQTNTPYFFNGSKFISLAPPNPQSVTSLGGASGVIGLGSGLELRGSQLAISNSLLQQISSVTSSLSATRVNTVQGLSGDVSFVAGAGVSISGTTITNTGVVGLTSSDNTISITPNGNGSFDIKTLLGGPGAQSVLLGPVAAQTDNANNPSIHINKTGFGNLLELDKNGTNVLTVTGTGQIVNGTLAVTGATTIGGSLTVSGLGAGIVQSSAGGVIGSGAVDRNNNTLFSNGLSVSNGGTGAATLTANGILYGGGVGAIQATGSAASSVLITGVGNIPTLSQTLPAAVQGNITGTGILASGSITSGFGTISTTNNISTSAALQGGSLNIAAGMFTVDSSGNVLAKGTGTIQGSGGLTIGVPATTGGKVVFANSGNLHFTTLQGLAPAGQDQTITIPASSALTDTVCLQTLSNCQNFFSDAVGAGNQNYITKYTNANGTHVGPSLLYDNGTTVGVNTATPSASYVLDVNGNVHNSGNASVGGALDVAGATTLNGSLTVSGVNTFTSGTGNVTLNGAVSITGANTLTVATGSATFGGTVTASGLTTLNGGLTVAGATGITGNTTINTSGLGSTSIGNASSSFALSSTGLNVSTGGALSGITTISASGAISAATSGNTINGVVINAGAISGSSGSFTGALSAATTGDTINGLIVNGGALSGVTGVTTNGSYTQSGVGANTFSGTTSFTAAGNGISVTNNANIGGNLTVQGSSISLGTIIQQGSLILNAGNGSTGSIQVLGTLAQNTIYTLPDPGQATATICLSTGNCAGVGGGVTTSGGTAGKISKFTGASTIGDSGLSESGTTLTYGGNAVVNAAVGFTGNLINLQLDGVSKLTVSETGAATLAGPLTVQSGGAAITGNSTISGTLTGLTGLTSSGTITFSGLGSAGVVHAAAGGALSTGAVALGSDTSGSYVANLGTLTGLTTSGNSGAGSTPTLSVDYGSTANTAVQGNTTLTCASGTGNLSGGGGTITLGTGGSCGNISITNSPTFSGTLTVQGAGGLTLGVAGLTQGALNLANSSNSFLARVDTALIGQATTYTLPDPGVANDTICLQTLGNCGGTNPVSGVGTTNKIAKFTGASTIGDSLISDDGTAVTVGANLIANSLTTGTIQSAAALNITPGGLLTIGATNQRLALQGNSLSTFSASAGGFTTALGFVMPTANHTINLPDETGTVCLQGSANCGFATTGSGVTSITGSGGGSVAAAGAITFNNATTTGSAITIDNASTTVKGIAQFNSTNFTASAGTINTIQNINSTAAVTFGSLTLGAAGNLTLSATGSVLTDSVKSTSLGSDITFDANNGILHFITGGGLTSFVFPTNGGANQVICTSGITCATGGGVALVLEPGGIQTASANTNAIYVNKQTGTGNLLQLQTGGVDAFVISNTGNATFSNTTTAANLTVTGTLTANTITPTGALTVGSTSQAFTLQGTGTSSISATNGSFNTNLGFAQKTGTNPQTGHIFYAFENDDSVTPNTAGTPYFVCTTAGNCSGVGGSVTTGGTATAGRIAKFTSSGNIDQSIINESGSTISVLGNLQVGVLGNSTLSIGVASTVSGSLVFNNATNANTLTLQQTAAPSANITIGLPNQSGTVAVAASGPLVLDATTGQLTCPTCLTSGGGGSGGVSTITGTTAGSAAINGALTLNNALTSGTTITIDDAKADGTTKGLAAFNSTNFSAASGVINTAQNINTTATPTFGSLTLQGPGGLTLGNTTNLGQLAFKDGTADGFTALFSSATLTANRAITVPNAGGTLAVSASGNLSLSALGDLTISNSPTFSTSVTTPSLLSTGALAITPGGALTVGSNAQSLTLQGNASTTLKATNLGNTTTVGFATPTGARSITFPDSSGTVCLDNGNCNSGANASANAHLSNLTAVAINTSLLPGVAGAVDLGSSTLPFGQLIISGASGTPAINNFTITGTATAARTINLPDAGGTICLQNDTNCGFAASNNVVNSITGSAGGSVAAKGGVTFNNASTTGSALTIDNASTIAKGIASFNSTNFTASAGAINTVQDIATGSSPTFAGLTLTTALSVANGGTGATTLASKGILYGNGTGSILATTAAANSVLVTDGVSTPSLSQTLPTAVQGNITSTGALASGSIASGFGTISTGNNITTTAAIQGGTLNIASGAFTVDASGNLASTGAGSIKNGLTLGNATTVGALTLHAGNGFTGGLQVLATLGQNTVYTIPDPAQATAEVCIKYGSFSNCAGSGGGVTSAAVGAGNQNFLTKFSNANGTQIDKSQLFDNGSFVGINTSTNSGQLSVVASGTQSGFFIQGAATGSSSVAIIKDGGSTGNLLDLQNSTGTTLAKIDNTGVLTAAGATINGSSTFNGNVGISGTNTLTTATGAVTFGSLTNAGSGGIVTTNGSGLLSSGTINRDTSGFLTGTLSVGNGGTGATTLTSKGLLLGNGTSAISATNSAANSVLVTNGTNDPSLSQTLPTAVQGNITSVGALTSGSIGSGFGTISTGNNITTTAALQGDSLSVATGAFSVANTGALTSTASASIQGALTLGKVGPAGANGALIFANSANANLLTINAPTLTAARTYTFPDSSAASDTVCLVSLANCSGVNGGSGNANYIQNGTALQSNANFNIQTGNANNVVGVLRAASGQIANIFELKENGGNLLTSFDNTGKLGFADGAGGAVDANLYRSAANTLKTDSSLIVGGSGNGSTTFGALFKNGTDSTTALQVQNAAGTNVLNVDTINSQLSVRNSVDNAALGGELVTSQDFTSANWLNCNGGVGGWSGTVTNTTHNTGNNVACSATASNFTVTAGVTYQVTFQIAGNTTATNVVAATIGAASVVAVGTNATHTLVITASNTNALTFTPGTNFNGTISNVSVKVLTKNTSALAVKDGTSNTTQFELRATSTNTGLGMGSLQSNISGTHNTATGYQTLQSTTTGSDNVALGYQSLWANTTGNSNTAVGSSALRVNTTGNANTAIGNSALAANTTGDHNTAVGNSALSSNKTGGYNVALGDVSLIANTTGSNNTAINYSALAQNTTGSNNIGIGVDALYANTTGSNNTAIGYFAGYQDPNAASFVTLGSLQNSTALGYGAQVQQSNSIVLGSVGTVASNLTPNVGIGTTSPSNLFSVSPNIYDTGTASTTASATVVGVGTTWTASMVGDEFIFANGNKYTITGFTDATHLTLSASSTNSSQAYRIHNPAFYVSGTGSALHRTSTNSTTAFQVQNASGANVFTVDTSNGQLAVGPSAVPANGVLTIGTNTTAASGGLYFGTDTNLYRFGANSLRTDSYLTVQRSLATDGALGTLVNGDTFDRLRVLASGEIQWGSGSAARDIGISRTAAGTLTVQGQGAVATTQIIKAGSSQSTTDLAQLQDNSGNINASFNATGNQLTLGRVAAAGTVTQGKLVLSDGTTSNKSVTLQVGDGLTALTNTVTLKIPTNSAATDTVCLLALANCAGAGAGVTATGYNQNYLTKFNATTNQITVSQLFDNGTNVGLNVASGFGTVARLTINANGTADNTAIAQFNSGAAANKALVIQGAASQTADLAQFQASNGVILAAFNASGQLVFGPSGSQDTNLYRSGTSSLKTDGAFTSNSLVVGGTPASPSSSQLQLGSVAITSGSASGTYIGSNPATFAGDFINLMVGNSSKFKVDNAGTISIQSSHVGQTVTACTGGQTALPTEITGGVVTGVQACATTATTSNTFTIGGNSVAAAAALGTTNAFDLNILTNNIQRLNISTASGSNNSTFTFTGIANFKPSTDTTSAFSVQSFTGSASVFNVDTTNRFVGIGTASPTAQLHVSGANLQPTATGAAGTAASNAVTVVGATGGNTTSTAGNAAGAGAALSFTGGTGGSATGASGANTGGTGGAITLNAGAGGTVSSSTGTAGAGGAITLVSGSAASLSSATQIAAPGGAFSIQGGAGSNGTGVSNNGAGGAITIVAGSGGTGGSGTANAGGNLTLQGGAKGGTGSIGSVIVKANGSESTSTFQIQNSTSTALLTADTTNMVIKIGAATTSITPGLAVGTAEVNTRLLIGTTTDGLDVNTAGGTNAYFRLKGNARNLKSVKLAPEFAGMILHADTTNNTGSLTSDIDTGSGYHSYYNWTTTQATAQDYDMYVRVPVPRDFSAFPAGAQICYYVWTDDTTPANSVITTTFYDTANTAQTGFTATPTAASTWQQKCTTNIGGTVTVDGNSYFTVQIHFTAAQNKNTRIGEFTFDYLSQF